MKIAIIYFSLSGRTETLSALLKESLESEGYCVSEYRLSTEATGSFLKNCADAFTKKKVNIEGVPDVSRYEMVFLCSPVWAFDIAPAMRTYLRIADLSGKRAFLVLTYGSGKGKERAMNIFSGLVEGKGASLTGKGYIKGRQAKELFPNLEGEIKKCLKKS